MGLSLFSRDGQLTAVITSACLLVVSFLLTQLGYFKTGLAIFSIMQILSGSLSTIYIKRAGFFDSFYIFVFLFVLANTVTTGLWVFYADTSINQISDMLLVQAFSMSGAVLIFGITAFMLTMAYQQTQNIQIIIDTFAKTLIYGGFVWLFLFGKEVNILDTFSMYHSYMLVDIFTFSVLTTIFLSIKTKGISLSFWLVSVAVGIYSVYGFLAILPQESEQDVPLFESTSILYSNSLYILVFGMIYMLFLIATIKIKKDILEYNTPGQSKYQIINKNFILLGIPIFLAIFSEIASPVWISFLILIILIHMVLTFHISSTTRNKEMLNIERLFHADLDKQVQERKEQLARTNKQLRDLSRFDSITNVLNKSWFLEALQELITQKPLGYTINLYSIDINKFKVINDIYGHYIGDGALKQMAQIIKDMLPPNSLIGRFGSDELLVATTRRYDQNDTTELATNIIKKIKEPLEIEKRQIQLNSKIGITSTNINEVKAHELLEQSELALLQAKNSSDSFAFYCDELSKQAWENEKIQILMQKAELNTELEVLYQPQYNTNTQKIVSLETLIRWHSKEKGEIEPSKFIPAIEKSNKIIEIGNLVLEKASNDIGFLNARFNQNLGINLNVSLRQIENINFTQNIIKCITDNSIDPKNINIEIKEKDFIIAQETAIHTLKALHNKHINITIDDFGTSISSMENLKLFNISKIKISKSIIQQIDKDEQKQKILKAIIALSKNMGIKSVAMGVQTKQELEIIKKLRCDEFVGYLFNKPLNLDQITQIIKAMPQAPQNTKVEVIAKGAF